MGILLGYERINVIQISFGNFSILNSGDWKRKTLTKSIRNEEAYLKSWSNIKDFFKNDPKSNPNIT